MRRFVVLLAAVAIAGCSNPGANKEASQPPRTPSPADPELAQRLSEFADCLRSRGIEILEPEYDEEGNVSRWPHYAFSGETRGAEKRCGGRIAELGYEPQGPVAEYVKRAEVFADCMVEQGIKDIEVTVEGIRIGPRWRGREILRAAERECAPLMDGA